MITTTVTAHCDHGAEHVTTSGISERCRATQELESTYQPYLRLIDFGWDVQVRGDEREPLTFCPDHKA